MPDKMIRAGLIHLIECEGDGELDAFREIIEHSARVIELSVDNMNKDNLPLLDKIELIEDCIIGNISIAIKCFVNIPIGIIEVRNLFRIIGAIQKITLHYRPDDDLIKLIVMGLRWNSGDTISD